MPNVCLITHDDQPLILPAHTICAIICVTDQVFENLPGAESMIYTQFRGGSSYFLGQSSADVLAEIIPADPNSDRWVTLAAELSDGKEGEHIIDRSILQGFIGHAKGGLTDDRPWLEGFIYKPGPESNPAAREAMLAIKSTPENRETLSATLLAETVIAPAPAAPKPARGRRK